MKKLTYIYCLIIALMCNACSDYLDINDDPDTPNNTVPLPSLRLRSILTQFVDCYDSSGTRGSWITGNITKINGTTYNDYIIKWRPDIASTTWPYQAWFVYTAANLPDLFDKCEELGAWHYLGVGQLIHAWGFMIMTDLYGEMPYTEALGTNITPKFDDGETIYYGCMEMLEEAINNLQKTQESTAEPLADGDLWHNGDTDKWLKLAHGLKARWLLKASKKNHFDPQEVLDVLQKAPQSNADNTVMRYINPTNTQEAALRSLQHQNLGSSTDVRMSKWYMDLLKNTFTGGSEVLDPRTTLLAPSGQFMNENGELEYRLTEGVDMYSNIRTQGGPVSFSVYASSTETAINFLNGTILNPEQDIWASATTEEARKGDSIYIPIYSYYAGNLSSTNKPGDVNDDRYIADREYGISKRVISTGTFYTRADGPSHLMCYPEICFIKAECYFRLGQKGQALTEYKKGIRAHMELMNEKLEEYDQSIYGKQVIPESAINDFLSSTAVAQNESELTMAKIMQQKFIALSYTLENFNDMRRFNYSAGNIKDYGVVYPDYGRPGEFDAESALHYTSSDPNNERYWFRRFQHCSHEKDRNSINHQASNPEALEKTINSYPVWWDTAD